MRQDGAVQSADRQPIVCVSDATNLKLNLRLVLEVKRLGLPMLLALNMTDLAAKRGIAIDVPALARELGMPVVSTVAVRRGGAGELISQLEAMAPDAAAQPVSWLPPDVADVTATQREVRRILAATVREPALDTRLDERIDRVILHPLWGMLILAGTLFLMFQAVFSWASLPMEWIKDGVAACGEFLMAQMPEGILRSLLVDGIIAGVGSVLVFLPQILILFLFILALEDSGYLPRAYALIIGAFIPESTVAGVFNLQGLVLFVLYVAGILSAMAVAGVLKLTVGRGQQHPLMLELPSYRWPHARNLLLGLVERARIFIMRVGNIILALMVVLWFLSSFPAAPEGASGPAIYYSYAGMLGRALAVIFAPVGFNWEISIALVPGMAAREVAVGALGTVYALSATGDDVATQLAPMLAAGWSLPTAFSLLAWYVFSPQCLSTLAVVKRETNSWRYPLLMAGYLFALAYGAAFVTYRIALFLTGAGHA
ncbi:MAG: Ferrous iron transport protein B [Candidatus Accumulibacter phosphatis]|uniref:Ferrous iron transport protein B n=1 Tax=Candidatus Accumulibacter phosphatis TaxID=327160 RepID=A0A080M0Y5_9PROT|nr:MAG: Ferrous iron transport protein B [Candidatus Accumulibacter phosphatis]